MNVLYLCADPGVPVLGRKGASVHVRSFVAALTRAGHSVLVACPVLTKSPWDEPAELNGRLLHLPPGPETTAAIEAVKTYAQALEVESPLAGDLRRILYDREVGPKLERKLRRHPPDLIIERACLYGTAGVAAARALGVPLLIELNAPLTLEQKTYRSAALPELAERAERTTLLEADAVITVSKPLAEYVVGLGVPDDRVHIVPNGVDPSIFRPGPSEAVERARWRLGEGPVLGFVGGLRPWHGVEILPLLLERLIPDHPSVRLVVVGDGPLRQVIEGDFRKRGLERRVVFTGTLSHEDIPGLIRQFDVALAPYPRPGHPFYFSPLKVFEYMGCGAPVVAADLGQISEVVLHEETGLLYPPGDVDALASACDRLLSDAPLREQMGRRASEEILQRYTIDGNAARVVDLGRELLRARE